LIEYAPSGAYVEDWRLQPSGDGPLIGMSLLEERDAKTGQVTHRGGGWSWPVSTRCSCAGARSRYRRLGGCPI